jgi:ABC-type nitrate/sulfonate/bicarbonate transport system ATPase subunit
VSAALLELSRISTGYNGQAVLGDVNLSVREREVVALMGRSGCGKTTVIRVAAGLLPAWHGAVRRSLTTTDRYSVMFQSPRRNTRPQIALQLAQRGDLVQRLAHNGAR